MRDIRDIKAAVVGTGFIGVVHVEALRRLGIEVTGIVGSTPGAGAPRRRAPRRCRLRIRASRRCSRTRRVDVVHLTTPNHLHYEQVRAALAAGKHVVCEKPLGDGLGRDRRAAARSPSRAGSSTRSTSTSASTRSASEARGARARAATIGDVRLVSGGYLQDWLLLDTDWNWRLDPAAGGALRAVGDIGSHWLDLVQFVTGRRVEAVMADLTTFIPVRKQPTGPVETFSGAAGGRDRRHARWRPRTPPGILLRLERRRARGRARSRQVSAGRKNRLQLGGRRLQQRARVGVRGARGAVDRPPRPARTSCSLTRGAASYPPGHAEGFPDTFSDLYRAVYAAVAAGGPPAEPDYPTFADGHDEAVIADAIARSHAEQRWVDRRPRAPGGAE